MVTDFLTALMTTGMVWLLQLPCGGLGTMVSSNFEFSEGYCRSTIALGKRFLRFVTNRKESSKYEKELDGSRKRIDGRLGIDQMVVRQIAARLRIRPD